jgi:hypothetical protein
MVPLSILDLVHVTEGSTPRDALRRSLDLARHAERLGYNRFWVAEHHNMPGIASAATAVVIGYLAAGTSTIRVGAGGVMLPNHAPLVVAEQFGTLETLYPGRIDLGLGRAPAPTSARCTRSAATPPAPTTSRGTCRSCRPSSARCGKGRRCRPSRAAGRRCRCGSWGRACSARSSPRRWACPTPSPRTSRPTR